MKFRQKLMKIKRRLKLDPVPRFRIRAYVDNNGHSHCEFGYYGRQECPTKWDESGNYIKGQPFYLHMSGTINVPGYKHRWNRDLQLHFWNYIRRNKHNIHPLDLAK
ncbi:hypothetical protein [uncultured Clostridium sp.]|uniref:hypothetical protein n=1 Tax=uncultured Clostridium sp. TaxID=59620 RepID=UPI00261A5F02|nr:hypothetical protein [uncultured Clostridium sp.]